MIRKPPSQSRIGQLYDDHADAYDARWEEATNAVRRFVRIDEPQRRIAQGADRVLEIGAGTGRLQRLLDGGLVVGLDPSMGMLRHAAASGLTVVGGAGERLPFDDGVFDAVCAGNGVWRYLNYGRAFAECWRVLRPGGRVAVHQFARDPWSLRGGKGSIPEEFRSLQVRHPDELRSPAVAAGFTVESLQLWRSVSFPPYLLALPVWIAAPCRLWTHLTFVFKKP